MPSIEERLDTLESILGQFIVHTDIALRKLENEMKEFKNEMKTFKDEMKAFKDEIREENRNRNREWSNLAKKMGTLVEDLIAPALRPVLSKYFNCDVAMEGQRMFRRKNGEDYEIDAIAVCDDKIFIVEVRSTPRVNYVDEITEKKKRFFEFFPEYEGKELLVIYGSITFEENVIRYASKNRIYVMGWKEWEYMDILNFDEVS